MKNMKKLVDITVLSARKAKDFVSETPWAAIQVSTHPGDFPKLNQCQLKGILTLSFPDLDAPSDIPIIGPEGTMYESIGEEDLFGPEHALEICRFVDTQIHNGVNKFLIHCQAGYSRSPAIAAALEKILNGASNMHTVLVYPDNCAPSARFLVKSSYTEFYGTGNNSQYFDPEKYSPNMRVYETLLKIGLDCRWFYLTTDYNEFTNLSSGHSKK